MIWLIFGILRGFSTRIYFSKCNVWSAMADPPPRISFSEPVCWSLLYAWHPFRVKLLEFSIFVCLRKDGQFSDES